MDDLDRRIALLTRAYKEADDFRDKDTAVPNPFTGQEIRKPWYYYDRIFRGFHWDSTFVASMASWASRPVKNMAFSGILGYTTMITDNNPSIVITPREPGDTDLANTVKVACDTWWKRQHMQQKIALAVLASRIYGISWLRLYHDEKKGECCTVVHPESILVDPDTTIENFDPAYLIYESRQQVGELREKFHGKKLPDGTTVNFDTFIVDWKVGRSTDSPQYDRYEVNTNPAKTTSVYEFYYKDDAKVVWDDEDILPGKKVGLSRPKYPGGRKVIIAGGVVLSDEKNPYDHGEYPFTPVHAFPVPGKFYGMGDIQNILNPMIMRNRLSQFLIDQTLKSGGGYVLVGQASGIDASKVSNAPIQILPCRDPNAFRVERAPAPSRHVFDHIGILDGEIADMLGLHDISMGRRSQGNPVTAQEAMMLAESDRTRVRFSSRLLAETIERLTRQLLANWVQWPNFKWMLRVAGQDSAVEFSGKMLKKEKDGKLTQEAVDLDLEVADSSTLPASQQENTMNIERWLAWGVITPDDILKYKMVDIPHAEAILADRMQAQEAAAQAQAMQPPMPAGMAPAPDGGVMSEVPMEGVPLEPPPDAAMMEQMLSPVPEDIDPEAFLAAVQQIAAEQGISEEQAAMMLVGGA